MNSSERIKFLQLPFHFDEVKLVKDLEVITEEGWLPQVYTMNYEGGWTSLALMSANGENDNFCFGNNGSKLVPTEILNACPYISEVIQSFQCPVISARLLRLHAGAHIKPHEDFKLGYQFDNFRLHVPIVTHADVEFYLEDDRIIMNPGTCWYIDTTYTHSVRNNSPIDRIHLVMDFERNDWSDKLFFENKSKGQFGIASTTYDASTLENMITSLKLMNDPNVEDLINDLQQQLDQQ